MSRIAAKASLISAAAFVALGAVASTPVYAAETSGGQDVKVVSKVTAGMVDGKPGNKGGSGTVTMYYHGDRIRVENDNGMGHSVLLVDAAARKMYTLKPATKTYTVRALGGGSEMAGRVMSMMDVKTQANLSPIPTKKMIAGKPAHGYKFKAVIAMSLKAGAPGMPPPAPGAGPTKPQPLGTIEITGEDWVTDAVRLPGKGLAASFNALGGGTSDLPGAHELTEKLSKVKGLTVAQSETIVMTGLFGAFLGGGNMNPGGGPAKAPAKASLHVSSEAVSVTEGPLPPTLFEIPPGYKQVAESMPGMPGQGPGMAPPGRR